MKSEPITVLHEEAYAMNMILPLASGEKIPVRPSGEKGHIGIQMQDDPLPAV